MPRGVQNRHSMVRGEVALNHAGFFGADDQAVAHHRFDHLRPASCAPLPGKGDVKAVAGREFLLNKLAAGER